ncbi:tetratricopeptide repeat protein [Bradyrhizobium manausense]|uniref:adenylate/guanylate cyclase domain-containing protein n=1 Tax=Bradyrhizobium TaxID=374 RepID=UPI001BA89CA0|nr:MULTISPECIES: adenylate/guanylate cyclase domain-containing protein [Bradyrhizobium]MBR0829407.1 tetratricopeptide repeat protein [Bradyrhizobium manausense]UVO25786.1 tetratricopeptide repeat protein [Bradyrhizobium arachidis]
MAGERVQRRLAAILAADIAGYSRLMGADEEGTLAQLKAHRHAQLDPKIEEHLGRIVKTTGDGMLAEFASVVDALRCAIEIQRGMLERNADVPLERRIEFRVGINVGDIIIDGGDIYGDGVNVAARLEGLAEPGGICVSGRVQEDARGKLDIAFEDAGEQQLKNIAWPVRVYRVRLGGETTQVRSAVALPLALPDKPSIVVLPFTNMSGDSEQDYFADGVTEDIITGLSRARWLFVIARNSSFAYRGRSTDVKQVAHELGVRYVLEGSIRKVGERVRISAQLAEGTSGRQLWAKRYDRELSDIFAMQDEITETIIGAVEPELGKVERRRSAGKRPDNLDAWDLYQRGMSHLYEYTKEDLQRARQYFVQAIAKDPQLGPAHSGLAETYYYEGVYGFAESISDNREKALAPALRAVVLDAEDAGAHCTLGRAYYMRRAYDAAFRELKTALELNPSLALAHYGLGATLLFSGRAAESIPHLTAAIRLSPHDPNMGSFLVRLADAAYFLKRYEEAAEWAMRALQQPNFQWSRYTVLIAALAQLGRLDEARNCIDELQAKRPNTSIAFVRETHLFGDTASFAHYLDGLRMAGLPD